MGSSKEYLHSITFKGLHQLLQLTFLSRSAIVVYQSFGDVFMLSRYFLDCSVGEGVFVTGLSQISSFFSSHSHLAKIMFFN